MKRLVFTFFIVTLLMSVPAWAAPLQVFVTVQPQKYFVEKVGGDQVAVSVLVSPGFNPHAYEPKPAQMKALAGAAVFFTIGDPSEKVWLPRIKSANPSLKIVETQAGVERMPMAAHHDDDDHDGKGHHEHEAGAPDPHIWTSPRLVAIQARSIAAGLEEADPGHAEAYRANLASFERELEALDAELKATLSTLPKGAEFMVFHPSWGYFARDYGLTQVPIEIEGKEPKPREIKDLVEQAKGMRLKVILVQPQFSEKTARTVAEATGAKLITADPLAPDWANNLRAVAAALRDAAAR